MLGFKERRRCNMRKGKGLGGETCYEAIHKIMKKQAMISADELFEQVKKVRSWTDDTIWQHIMAATVNLYPAFRHWPASNEKRFLFQHEDGRYELYNPDFHGPWEGGVRRG